MPTSVNACPIDGCTAGRRSNQLMCKRHWYRVPKEIRDRVWSTARRMWADDDGGESEWQEARGEAITAVEAKLDAEAAA